MFSQLCFSLSLLDCDVHFVRETKTKFMKRHNIFLVRSHCILPIYVRACAFLLAFSSSAHIYTYTYTTTKASKEERKHTNLQIRAQAQAHRRATGTDSHEKKIKMRRGKLPCHSACARFPACLYVCAFFVCVVLYVALLQQQEFEEKKASKMIPHASAPGRA